MPIALQRTKGAGKCWSSSSTEANLGSGQARRGRHNPQEQSISRAKFTLFEGKGEPCSTVQIWTLPIANHRRFAQLVGCCLPQQENNIFLELSHHIKILPPFEFSIPRFVHNLPLLLTVSICNYLLLMIFLFLGLICSGNKQTSKQWII